MRYAFVSDFHGNLEAFDAVLEDIDMQNVDSIFSLGDIVGYGANSKECVGRIREREIQGVMGNHEWALLGHNNGISPNTDAWKAMEMIRPTMDSDDFEFLGGLPFVLREENILMAHANIVRPESFEYLLLPPNAQPSYKSYLIEENFDFLKEEEKLFVGHTHIPFKLAYVKRFLTGSFAPVEELLKGKTEKGNGGVCRFIKEFLKREFGPVEGGIGEYKVICNVGSVGRPRDGDSRACYAIYDNTSGKIDIRRVEYDVERAARKIRDAGLPEELAERLFSGR